VTKNIGILKKRGLKKTRRAGQQPPSVFTSRTVPFELKLNNIGVYTLKDFLCVKIYCMLYQLKMLVTKLKILVTNFYLFLYRKIDF